MSKKVFKFDSSALMKSSCEYRFDAIVVQGYRDPKIWNDTHYGSSFHKFVSRMYESNGNFAAATVAARDLFRQEHCIRPKKEHLTEKHLMLTCLDFWEKFAQKDNFEILVDPHAICWRCKGYPIVPNHEGGTQEVCKECEGAGHKPTPMVEQQFQILVYSDDEMELYLSGTIDKFGKFKNGAYAVGDYKVTSSWDAIKFLNKFRGSPQLKTYIWALKKLGEQNPDGPFARFTNSLVGAFIDGVFVKSAKETEFIRSEVYFPKDEDMAEFECLLADKINQLVAFCKGKSVPRRNGLIEGTCMEFGGCAFFPACTAVDKVAGEYALKKNFIQKPYDPLNFHESAE